MLKLLTMKNKRIFYLAFISLLFLSSTFLNAQDKVIHGWVTTFDSIPVVGAEVKVKSTKQIVATDTLGRFTAETENEDKLVIRANGFYNQRVKLGESIKLVAVNLKLKPGERNREIAVGYGYITDENRLNSVAGLDSDDMNFSQYTSILDAIEGRFAGVQVMNGEIRIRGINSINSSTAPLIILDDMPVDVSYLNNVVPSAVKSINVLKDGSASIYGARGANGVIIVETKSGDD